MAPPPWLLNLDVKAISSVFGAISIAAWVVVFSPQIAENFRRRSADGLSVLCVCAWLLGDIFNILGAIFQGVLPTMLILAIYYGAADIVLLTQCFYYKDLSLQDNPEVAPRLSESPSDSAMSGPTESTALSTDYPEERSRGSLWTHLSPAVPIVPESVTTPSPALTKVRTFAWSFVAVSMVCAAGGLGWFLSHEHLIGNPTAPTDVLPALDVWGQIFGWLCAVFYLGSRLPQLFSNFRRNSPEDFSVFYFLFACLGNLTYVLSIFAYEPVCHRMECRPGQAGQIYGRHILINASWLAGSLGTLLLDLSIFAKFVYENGRNMDDDQWDQRPLLDRVSS